MRILGLGAVTIPGKYSNCLASGHWGARIPGLGAVTIPDYTWNRPAKMMFPSGTQRVYGYDALMRLKSLTATDPGGNPLMEYQYTYDATGNIVTKATEHGEYGYGYDSMSRLISAENPVLDEEAYTYDVVGNRLTSAEVTGNWTYNDNNELLGYGNVEYVYDENGNVIQKLIDGQVVMYFFYNLENRLVKVEDGNHQTLAEYYYDPFGRRLWKEVGGERTYFFYSEEGLIGEYDATGTILKTYGYKPDSMWMTSPVFLKQGDDYYFYQNDHLGTPMKLLGTNGSVVWSAQYHVYGEAEVDSSSGVTNNLRFPGQYYDDETGLHYNYHRYYEPTIGRYVRVDPMGLYGDINPFVYGENNPLTLRDVYGLYPTSDVVGCCGPDVTDGVNKTLDYIRMVYDQYSKDKWEMCTTIYGLTKSPDELAKVPRWVFFVENAFLGIADKNLAANAWDINDLFDIGSISQIKPSAIATWRDGDVKDGWGPGCEQTVAYGGKCFNAGYLNYLMWGVMNQRCHQSFEEHPRSFIWTLPYSKLMAWAWKKRQYFNEAAVPEVLAAVEAGYRSWGACTPHTSEHRHCSIVEAGSAPSDRPWTFTWRPNIIYGLWEH